MALPHLRSRNFPAKMRSRLARIAICFSRTQCWSSICFRGWLHIKVARKSLLEMGCLEWDGLNPFPYFCVKFLSRWVPVPSEKSHLRENARLTKRQTAHQDRAQKAVCKMRANTHSCACHAPRPLASPAAGLNSYAAVRIAWDVSVLPKGGI